MLQEAFYTMTYEIVGDGKSVSYFEIEDSSMGDITVGRGLSQDPDLSYVVCLVRFPGI